MDKVAKNRKLKKKVIWLGFELLWIIKSGYLRIWESHL